jgi:outer membrane usher protein FimD/PapC
MNLIRELVFASILIVLSLRSCEGPSPQKKSLNIQKETPSLIKEPVKKTKNKINSSIYDRITKNATELLQPSPTPIESLSNQKKDQISLLLKVENFYPEDVFAYVNDKDPDKIDPDQIEIEFNPVKEKLAMILPLSKMKDLDGSVKNYENNSWIPLKSLKDLGLDVVYDSNSLSVQIKIPATQKESKTVSLARETEISLNNALEPSPISGFTNFYYNKTHLSGQIFANSSTYNPSVTYVDSALNVYKWVLESTGSYVEGQGYQRDQLRVVRDDEKNGVRYSVGDVSSPYGGFLASTSVGGVNVSRQDEITPYRVVYPINDTQILVKTRVSIDVEINGFTMYSTDLDS